MKTRRVLSLVSAVVIGCLFTPGAARAVLVSTFDHDGNGFASGAGADAHVSENSPGSLYGNAIEITIRNSTGSQQQYAYYRFDLSAVNKGQAKSVKLQVYDYRFDWGSGELDNDTFDVWVLNNEALDTWPEAGVSWNAAPGHTAAAPPLDGPDLNSDATHLGSFTYHQHGSGPWNLPVAVSGLTNAVRNDTNDLLTLMIVGPAGNATAFRTGTKETNRLSLKTNTPIPVGSAATRLQVLTNTKVVTTFDHDGDGLASGNGADSWISENSKTSNYGTSTSVRFRDNAGSNHQDVGYMRFDLSAVEPEEIAEAQLQLYDYRFSEGNLMNGRQFRVWGLVNEADDSWIESGTGGLTWNNAPGHTDDGLPFDDPDMDADAVFLGTFTFHSQDPTNGWSEPIDLPGLADFLRSDTNDMATLMITGPQGFGSLFYMGSKESVFDRRINGPVAIPLGTIAPRLLLTVPEPSALALLGLGLSGLGFLGRRRRSQPA